MGKFNKIIKVNVNLYECMGIMSVERSNDIGTEYWKERWGADNVLRNGNEYYY